MHTGRCCAGTAYLAPREQTRGDVFKSKNRSIRKRFPVVHVPPVYSPGAEWREQEVRPPEGGEYDNHGRAQ